MCFGLNCPIIILAWWLQIQHDKNLKIVLRSQISSSSDTRPMWTDKVHIFWKWLECGNRLKISVTSSDVLCNLSMTIKCVYIAKDKKKTLKWNEIEQPFSFHISKNYSIMCVHGKCGLHKKRDDCERIKLFS